MLSEPEIQRYSRHILLREVGGRGQQKLSETGVRIPSLNAGGRAAALWLARSGVGRLLLPHDLSPCPVTDPSGLLFAADAERPLSPAVAERLLFHAPQLAFEGAVTLDLPETHSSEDGVRAALSLVRRIVGN